MVVLNVFILLSFCFWVMVSLGIEFQVASIFSQCNEDILACSGFHCYYWEVSSVKLLSLCIYHVFFWLVGYYLYLWCFLFCYNVSRFGFFKNLFRLRLTGIPHFEDWYLSPILENSQPLSFEILSLHSCHFLLL